MALLLAGLCAFARTPAADDLELEWVEEQVLAQRDVALDVDRGAGRAVEIRAAVLIEAPVDAVWEVLTACEEAPEYVAYIVSCELLETLDEGRTQIFRQTVRAVFFLPRFQHVFRLEYDRPHRVDVHRVSGPLEQLEGSWHVLPQEGEPLLLVHQLTVELDAPVPRFMVRARLRRDTRELMLAVRDRSEMTAAAR